MKRFRLLLAAVLILSLVSGCDRKAEAQGDTILATTYPMYYLTCRLTEGMENVSAELMISDSVSCLHDYTLTTEQMKKIEQADFIVMNGGGLEDFMTSALAGVPEGAVLAICPDREDPHLWLDPLCFRSAASKISEALIRRYPEANQVLTDNLRGLTAELDALQTELEGELSSLKGRELITFHDGFLYFAKALNLTIAASIEEEEGAEPSAKELQEICDLIEEKHIPAIFVEKNGSRSAAEIIARETGVKIYTLNTMMDGETDYFTAMRENVQAVKEALS